MATYLCARCGTLALPQNSNLVDGGRFVHRACQVSHAFTCTDDLCRGGCWPEPVLDSYDPDDIEPMGGDPWWREREL